MGCSRLLCSSLLSAARLAGCELKHLTQICLTLPRGGCVACVRPLTARYGGIGVVNPVIKRGGLANNGTSITTARIPACINTDVTSALRRTRLSRRRRSGSPSTKQLCNEAKLCCGTDSGSSAITHLHRKMLRMGTWNLRRRILQTSAGDRRRARRDVRLRASSLGWTPPSGTSSQLTDRESARIQLLRKHSVLSVGHLRATIGWKKAFAGEYFQAK